VYCVLTDLLRFREPDGKHEARCDRQKSNPVQNVSIFAENSKCGDVFVIIAVNDVLSFNQ